MSFPTGTDTQEQKRSEQDTPVVFSVAQQSAAEIRRIAAERRQRREAAAAAAAGAAEPGPKVQESEPAGSPRLEAEPLAVAAVASVSVAFDDEEEAAEEDEIIFPAPGRTANRVPSRKGFFDDVEEDDHQGAPDLSSSIAALPPTKAVQLKALDEFDAFEWMAAGNKLNAATTAAAATAAAATAATTAAAAAADVADVVAAADVAAALSEVVAPQLEVVAALPSVVAQPGADDAAPQLEVVAEEVAAQPGVVAQPQVAAQPGADDVAPQLEVVAALPSVVAQPGADADNVSNADSDDAAPQLEVVAEEVAAAQPSVVAQPQVVAQSEVVAQSGDDSDDDAPLALVHAHAHAPAPAHVAAEEQDYDQKLAPVHPAPQEPAKSSWGAMFSRFLPAMCTGAPKPVEPLPDARPKVRVSKDGVNTNIEAVVAAGGAGMYPQPRAVARAVDSDDEAVDALDIGATQSYGPGLQQL